MDLFLILLAGLASASPRATAAPIMFPRVPTLVAPGDDDHNLNFTNGLLLDPERVTAAPGDAAVIAEIARRLDLPASLLASFVAIAEDRRWVARDERYAYHFAPGLDWQPSLRGHGKLAEYARRAVQRAALEVRIKRGQASSGPPLLSPEDSLRIARDEISLRPPPRVQILVGDRGPVGKSALYLYYTLAARRERQPLHDLTRAADIADLTQRKIALVDRPVFVVDDWTRHDIELREILIEVLTKHRDLLAGSSVIITLTSEQPITAASTPADLDPRLARIADAIHFVPRPASPAAYARIIGRWGLRALDEDARYARLLGLEAFELQNLANASVVLELKTALETGVERCQKSLTAAEDAQRKILHGEVRAYRRSLNPSY